MDKVMLFSSRRICKAMKKFSSMTLNALLIFCHNREKTPENHNIFNTTWHCLPVLHQSKILKDIIKENNLIFSRRQPPTLKKSQIYFDERNFSGF